MFRALGRFLPNNFYIFLQSEKNYVIYSREIFQFRFSMKLWTVVAYPDAQFFGSISLSGGVSNPHG